MDLSGFVIGVVSRSLVIGAKGGLDLGYGSDPWSTDEKVGRVVVVYRPLAGGVETSPLAMSSGARSRPIDRKGAS
jgi:hypothetical protein